MADENPQQSTQHPPTLDRVRRVRGGQTTMIGLTSTQYAALKACADHGVPDVRWSGTNELFQLGLLEAHDNDMYGERSVSYSLSSEGWGALTIHEDEWFSVRFEDLQLLYETVTRNSGDGSEQLHEVMSRVAKVLGVLVDGED